MPTWLTRFGIAAIVVFVAIFVFRAGRQFADRAPTNAAASPSQGNFIPLGADGIQRVMLSFGSSNYTPEIIRIRRGIPVEITADMSRIGGCYSVIVIPAFGIEKQFTAADRILQFTPDRAGTFIFSCAMGMGRGRIVVE